MDAAKRGFFLVIEGLDGSGKTEIARRLVQLLRNANPKNQVFSTFEPHDPSCAGLFIRQVLTHRIKCRRRTLALAFAANRADHSYRYIERLLREGEHRVVVCDRYYLSSFAFQSDALSLAELKSINRDAAPPDLTIFLNAKDSTCSERMRRRSEDKDLFEKNLGETRERYRTAIDFLRSEGEIVEEVDADGSIPEVLYAVLHALDLHKPVWLRLPGVQPPLLPEPSVFAALLNGGPGIGIAEFASTFGQHWHQGPLLGEEHLRASLGQLTNAVDTALQAMSPDELGSLFLDHLRRCGYQVMGRMSWAQVLAFELAYEMPLGITQRGTAILLDQTRGRAMVGQRALDIDRLTVSYDDNWHQLSDFMVVFDPSSARAEPEQYDRVMVPGHGRSELVGGDSWVTPAIRMVTRADILTAVLACALESYTDEHLYTLCAFPELKRIMHEFLEQCSGDESIPEEHVPVATLLGRVPESTDSKHGAAWSAPG